MKYALDTDIFIDGFRNEDTQADVFAFLNSVLPFTYLSAVVMQELAAGARTAQTARDVQRGVFEHSNAGGVCLRLLPHLGQSVRAPRGSIPDT